MSPPEPNSFDSPGFDSQRFESFFQHAFFSPERLGGQSGPDLKSELSTVSLEPLELLTRENVHKKAQAAFFSPQQRQEQTRRHIHQRVNWITEQLKDQQREHHQALQQTNRLFENLLVEMETLATQLQRSFLENNMATREISCQIDADRSVGIFHILWNTLSFTARGNHQPLALKRFAKSPALTGRIVALSGDFHQMALYMPDQDFYGLLQYELASLYIPSDAESPILMTIRSESGEAQEEYLHPDEAGRLFLIKCLELSCASPRRFHEQLS